MWRLINKMGDGWERLRETQGGPAVLALDCVPTDSVLLLLPLCTGAEEVTGRLTSRLPILLFQGRFRLAISDKFN